MWLNFRRTSGFDHLIPLKSYKIQGNMSLVLRDTRSNKFMEQAEFFLQYSMKISLCPLDQYKNHAGISIISCTWNFNAHDLQRISSLRILPDFIIIVTILIIESNEDRKIKDMEDYFAKHWIDNS